MMLEIGEIALVINASLGRNIGKVVRVTNVTDEPGWCIEAEPLIGFLDFIQDECHYSTDEPVWFRMSDLLPIDSDRLMDVEREIAEWQDSYGVFDDE